MRKTASTPADPDGANVIEFTSADDAIPVITGVPLIDLDSAVLARRIRAMKWPDRARVFHNAICESLTAGTKALDFAKDDENGRRFISWSLVEMMRRIGEVLERLNADQPDSAEAAALFCLSLKPEHRRAGAEWTQRQFPSVLDFFAGPINAKYQSLGVLYRMTWVLNPAERLLWDAGETQPDCDIWFNLPDMPTQPSA